MHRQSNANLKKAIKSHWKLSELHSNPPILNKFIWTHPNKFKRTNSFEQNHLRNLFSSRKKNQNKNSSFSKGRRRLRVTGLMIKDLIILRRFLLRFLLRFSLLSSDKASFWKSLSESLWGITLRKNRKAAFGSHFFRFRLFWYLGAKSVFKPKTDWETNVKRPPSKLPSILVLTWVTYQRSFASLTRPRFFGISFQKLLKHRFLNLPSKSLLQAFSTHGGVLEKCENQVFKPLPQSY